LQIAKILHGKKIQLGMLEFLKTIEQFSENREINLCKKLLFGLH